MTRVVLDANVLAPAFVSPRASAGRLLEMWQDGVFELIVSTHILDELRRTYEDPYYKRRVSSASVEAVIELLWTTAEVVMPTDQISGVATHPEDDQVLSAAVAASADFLATRDRQLLKIGLISKVQIVHPSDLVARFEEALREGPP